MQKYLASMNERWDESKQGYGDMFGGETIPAGVYVAQLRKAELCLSKSKGQLQIKRSFAIVDGEQKGRSVRDYMNLETEYGFIFARRFLDVLGFQQPDSPEQLEGILAEVAKEMPVCKIEVKKTPSNNGGEFVNIQVNSRVDLEAGDAPAPETADDAPAPTETEEAPAADENRDALYAFCVANRVVEGADGDSDDAEQLVERIKSAVEKDGRFLITELSDEEKELLTVNGLEDCMAEPEKPKAPASRAPAARAAAPAKAPVGRPSTASKTGLAKRKK